MILVLKVGLLSADVVLSLAGIYTAYRMDKEPVRLNGNSAVYEVPPPNQQASDGINYNINSNCNNHILKF